MDIGGTLTTAATLALTLILAITIWFAWFSLSGKSNEVRASLQQKFANILAQLDEIETLQKEFNQVCAERSLGTELNSDSFRKFVTATRTAHREIGSLSAWQVLRRYPRYWHHAETHARYFAPLEDQIRDTIREIARPAAP